MREAPLNVGMIIDADLAWMGYPYWPPSTLKAVLKKYFEAATHKSCWQADRVALRTRDGTHSTVSSHHPDDSRPALYCRAQEPAEAPRLSRADFRAADTSTE